MILSSYIFIDKAAKCEIPQDNLILHQDLTNMPTRTPT